jgi:hypothetical protein
MSNVFDAYAAYYNLHYSYGLIKSKAQTFVAVHSP